MSAKIFVKVCIILTLFEMQLSTPISIAGMFEKNDLLEKTFLSAVNVANDYWASPSELAALTDREEPPGGGAFVAMNATCSFLAGGVAAVFGPRTPASVDAVQSVCDAKDVPHILTRWRKEGSKRSGTLINFYPYPNALTEAYLDIISAWKWDTFTVLYEDNESLLRISDLVSMGMEKGMVVTIEQLDSAHLGNYRKTFKKLKQTEQKRFVIDCHIDNLEDVLTQCQQMGMLTPDYNFFITNLDTHTINLTPFQFSEANITGIRIVDAEEPYVRNMVLELFDDDNTVFPNHPSKLRTEPALLIDAIFMFSKVISEIQHSNGIAVETIDCNDLNYWKHGLSLINILKTSSYQGLTGTVLFDNKGFRSNFNLNIYKLIDESVITVGSWKNGELRIISRHADQGVNDEQSMINKTFIVITALTDPYGMLKESSTPLHGNERFEGFGMDLIEALSEMEGFNYTFLIQEDKDNGKKMDDGKWSGMIGKVMYGEADLAITDLTIISEREEVVDFTSPFMNLGISILFRKPTQEPPSFFSFADPFALDTWIGLSVAFMVVSISFFILGRLCPAEWRNPDPCVAEPEYLVNQFSMGNSVWFVTGAMMMQGSEIAPVALSTRLVAGVWWFFVFVLISSYMASLASFLVTPNNVELFKDISSLVGNAEELGIRYGAKAKGATQSFFEGQKSNPIYQIIGKHMREHPEDMVSENKYGVLRAENPDPEARYAFFMESTSIEYETQRRCDLTMVGGLLDNKGYGIAMRKNSTYRTTLSTAILKLQASGEIDRLKRRWWQERRGGGQCEGTNNEQGATSLDLENVEGVFYVTILGTLFAGILVFVEHLIDVLGTSRKQHIKFKQVFKEEIKACVNFSSDTKPVIRKRSVSKLISSKQTLEEQAGS